MALFHSGVSIGLDLQRWCFIFFTHFLLGSQDGVLKKNTVLLTTLGYANGKIQIIHKHSFQGIPAYMASGNRLIIWWVCKSNICSSIFVAEQ